MCRSITIVTMCLLLSSIAAAADNFRIPKEQFYDKVHTIAVFPVENVVWENLNDCYRQHDFRLEMMIEWGALRINDYTQLSDTTFVNTIRNISDSTIEHKLQETGRFGIIGATQTADSIRMLMNRFNVRNARNNPLWGNYEHPYKDSIQQQCTKIMKTDAILMSGYHIEWGDKGYFVKYAAYLIDPARLDTLWNSSSDLGYLRYTNAKNVFYERDLISSINRAFKSIKKK